MLLTGVGITAFTSDTTSTVTTAGIARVGGTAVAGVVGSNVEDVEVDQATAV